MNRRVNVLLASVLISSTLGMAEEADHQLVPAELVAALFASKEGPATVVVGRVPEDFPVELDLSDIEILGNVVSSDMRSVVIASPKERASTRDLLSDAFSKEGWKLRSEPIPGFDAEFAYNFPRVFCKAGRGNLMLWVHPRSPGSVAVLSSDPKGDPKVCERNERPKAFEQRHYPRLPDFTLPTRAKAIRTSDCSGGSDSRLRPGDASQRYLILESATSMAELLSHFEQQLKSNLWIEDVRWLGKHGVGSTWALSNSESEFYGTLEVTKLEESFYEIIFRMIRAGRVEVP